MEQATGKMEAASAASWETWDAYYKQASQRRRDAGLVGRSQQLRSAKRKRRIRERVALAGAFVVLSGLMLIFYTVLTR
ncbi:MAG TPA: hypothetical protein VHG72_04490 [Polyangia bacterium]|nr:hypothetical protein [Polyangia bacterium]